MDILEDIQRAKGELESTKISLVEIMEEEDPADARDAARKVDAIIRKLDEAYNMVRDLADEYGL